MRKLGLLIIVVILGGGGFFAYRQLAAGPPVVLASPAKLQVLDGDTPLGPGSWIGSNQVNFEVGKPRAGMGVDVEVRPVGKPFSDSPTTSLAPSTKVCRGCAYHPSSIQVHLPDGSYHWQARLHSEKGVSPWVPYKGTLRVDTHPPEITHLSSSTDPNAGKIYHSWPMQFAWSGHDTLSGVAGYSYLLDTVEKGIAPPKVRTTATEVKLLAPSSGQFYFHVRAEDHAGNWSATATFPVHVSVSIPTLRDVRFDRYAFNPNYARLGVSFAVTQPASTVRVGFYRQSDGSLAHLYVLHNVPAGKEQTIKWDGKTAGGRQVAAGKYAMYVRTADAFGHTHLASWSDLVVEYKRIVVSLSQQRLWAYDGNKLFLTSLVTTGNSVLPTPAGTFEIEAKYHPFTFHSPWPKSSPFWYPPSLTQYAMLFRQGGFYIHDAPWRSVFGPGSNAESGTPGSNYTGTHGCVNVPANVAKELFAWAPTGTPVIIHG